MKFTLKDYQADAVDDVLRNLERARENFTTATGETSSFSLTATTGAGKTVMAAAVIEALFCGNDDVRLRPRPGRGRDLVLRRPEPERADAVPAYGRRPRSSPTTDLVHDRAAVRQAAARARARSTSSTPRSSPRPRC